MQPVRRAIMRAFLVCFLGAALQSLMPLIARDVLGGSADTFGLMLGFFGAGAVCGIFVMQPLREHLGNEKTLQLCCLAASATLAVLAVSTSLVLDFAVLLIAGMEQFGHRLEHAQRSLTLVSAGILAAMGMGFLLGLF
jgi:fucose permease